MKSLPMIFRFFSGSLTPRKAFRNLSSASTYFRFMWSLSLKISRTSRPSSLRRTPLLTKTQRSFLPIALWMSAATTDESTPPLKAHTTISSPASSCIFCVAISMNDFGEKSPFTPHILKRKFLRTRLAFWRMVDLGVKLHPVDTALSRPVLPRRVSCRNGRGPQNLSASSVPYPDGSSRQCRHLCIPSKKMSFLSMDIWALPYSRFVDFSTLPPKKSAVS